MKAFWSVKLFADITKKIEGQADAPAPFFQKVMQNHFQNVLRSQKLFKNDSCRTRIVSWD